ncbi:MAG: biotin carboxylase N-terminal domain-containing protein [Hyphomicrobiaceae bacterium]
MLKRVLIANRGEIACRIIRTARRLGIETVAVYSDADARALHVAMADRAVHIGPAPATESYLVAERLIEAARETGADSVHPGYGFLSENASFAEACAAAGLVFIGPPPEAMRRLGGKAEAKAIAAAAGVPVVPGYAGDDQDPAALASAAAGIGFPLMIKAVAGGGGRGLRHVQTADEFAAALDSAVREATAAFGDGRVLLEKLVPAPRHVEVQVFGDTHGSVVHLFERDCSLQRRHQKVVEEAPAPGMSPALREQLTTAACALARSVGYVGAGTVEFLVGGGTLAAEAPWYFIEMNTRLQVEHPVTEMITGLDLVEWQLRVAAGEPLPLTQSAIAMAGHAVEVRLYAEDPAAGFLPSTGRLVAFEIESADGVRVDSGVTEGDEISPFYDPMIAKIITHAGDRDACLDQIVTTLVRATVAGVRTNAAFLRSLVDMPDVRAVTIDTGLIGRALDRLSAQRPSPLALEEGVGKLIQAKLSRASHDDGCASPWAATDGFQLGGVRRFRVPVIVDGTARTFELEWLDGMSGPLVMLVAGPDDPPRPDCEQVLVKHVRAGDRHYVIADLVQSELHWPEHDATTVEDGEAARSVRAPMHGRLVKLHVGAGQQVAKGDRIAVVEAMKMEHVLHALKDGVVLRVEAQEGQQVAAGELLVALGEEGGA